MLSHIFRAGSITMQDATALNELVRMINRLKFTAAAPLYVQDGAGGVCYGTQATDVDTSTSFHGAFEKGPSTLQNVASGVNTVATFGQGGGPTVFFDTDGYVTGNKLTVPSGQGGTYLIGFGVVLGGSATGHVQAWARINGTTSLPVVTRLDATPETDTLERSYPFGLNDGDYVELLVFQNSGSVLSCGPNDFWLYRIGPHY